MPAVGPQAVVGPVAAAGSHAVALAKAIVLAGTTLLVDAADQGAQALHLELQVQSGTLQQLQAGQPAFRQVDAAREHPPIAEANDQAGLRRRWLGPGAGGEGYGEGEA